MLRYNFIHLDVIDHYEFCGIAIMLSEHYHKMIADDPGIMHQNFGDFYSETLVEDIADVVEDALKYDSSGRKLQPTIVVDTLSVGGCDPKNTYIVREQYGARIVMPEMYDNLDLSDDYIPDSFITEELVDSLVDDWTRGSLATVWMRDDEDEKPVEKNVLTELGSDEPDTIN